MSLQPFADEATVLQIGGLTIENRLDRISVYGSLDITRDQAGLRRACALQALLNEIVAALQKDGDALPEVKGLTPASTVRNPFA